MMKYLERRPVFVFPSFPESTLKSNFHLCPNWMSLLNYIEAAFPSHVPSRFNFKTFLATLQKQSSTPRLSVDCKWHPWWFQAVGNVRVDWKGDKSWLPNNHGMCTFPMRTCCTTNKRRNNLRNLPTLRHTLGSQCLQRLTCHVAAISSDCDNLIKSKKHMTLTSALFANFQLVPEGGHVRQRQRHTFFGGTSQLKESTRQWWSCFQTSSMTHHIIGFC